MPAFYTLIIVALLNITLIGLADVDAWLQAHTWRQHKETP